MDDSSFPISREELRKLYIEDEVNLESIAKSLGTSRQRVARWLNRWGIPRRNRAVSAGNTLEKKNGSRSPNWSGGVYISRGYRWIYAPKHYAANAKGVVLEHIFVASQILGRELKRFEIVHHKNLDRLDNEPINLCVMTRAQHAQIHSWLGGYGIRCIIAGHDVISELPEQQVSLVEHVYKNHQFCVSEGKYGIG